MSRTRRAILLAVASFAILLASAAFAKAPPAKPAPPKVKPIALKLLLGKWEGKLIASIGDQSNETEFGIEFQAGGKVLVGRREGNYKIDKDTIIFTDPTKGGEEDARFIRVKVDKTSFSAQMTSSSTDNVPEGSTVMVRLVRKK